MGGNISIITTEIAGVESAILGMRNPLDSWVKSDSYSTNELGEIIIGEADLELARRLISAGPEHRKFLRQIHVWADFEMPRYWWQEADTYHFGTKSSCSTMHTLHKSDFTLADFYLGENPSDDLYAGLNSCLVHMNMLRDQYTVDHDYKWIIQIKRLLPESFIQLRTWDTNYEELRNIYFQRKTHKLADEWGLFCRWCETLPYFKEFFLDEKG